MNISQTPAYCPYCYKLRANDEEVEKCIREHKQEELVKVDTILKISFEENLSENSIKMIKNILKNSLGFNTKIEVIN